MNIKLLKLATVALALTSFGFVQSSAVVPLPISLVVSDPSIHVGETFNVDVVSTLNDPLIELVGFGFVVDPLLSLANVTYLGATLAAGFNDLSLLPNEVVADAFPGMPLGGLVTLATLHFSADAVGPEVIQIQGLYDALFYGGYGVDSQLDPVDYDIENSVDVEVMPRSIPDTGSTAALLLASLAGLAALLKWKP